MIKELIREFPVTDLIEISMTEEKIRKVAYTKEEVNQLIAEAVEEARRITRHQWQNITVRPQLSV